MSSINDQLISELSIVLTSQRYSPVVIGNYCAYARGFLDYLALEFRGHNTQLSRLLAPPNRGRKPGKWSERANYVLCPRN